MASNYHYGKRQPPPPPPDTTSTTTTSTTESTKSTSTTTTTTSNTPPPPNTSTTSTENTSTTLTTEKTTPTPKTIPSPSIPSAGGKSSALPFTVTQQTTVVSTPSSSLSADQANVKPKGFFQNTAAMAATFTVAGLIAAALLFFLISMFLRKRRAKRLEREMEEAARDIGPAPVFLDDENDDYSPGYGGGVAGYQHGGEAAAYHAHGGEAASYQADGYNYPLPTAYSDVSSHGTYNQPGMQPGETYQMSEYGYGAGVGIAAGASGIGVSRTRSTTAPYPAFSSAYPDYNSSTSQYPASSNSNPSSDLSRMKSSASSYYNPHPITNSNEPPEPVPQKESYAAHYAVPGAGAGVGSGAVGVDDGGVQQKHKPTNSYPTPAEEEDDAYGGYSESELPNPFAARGSAYTDESEEDDEAQGGKVLKVANAQ